MGLSSGGVGASGSAEDWPRIMFLMPDISPRTEISAITTVISAITAPMAANRYTR